MTTRGRKARKGQKIKHTLESVKLSIGRASRSVAGKGK